MSRHQGNALTNAIITLLGNGGLLVGDGIKPNSGGWQGTPGESKFTPYVIVYPTPGGTTDGPIDDTDADAFPDYTLTAVGGNRQQCEWAADKVHDLMLSGTLTVIGRVVTLVRCDVLPGAMREDDAEPQVWFAPGRWRIFTTPA